MHMKKICCNQCGRALKVENEILMEDAFQVKKEWGYFSDKDLRVDRFTLCEECYDKLVSGFAIPIETDGKTEVLAE